VTAVTGELRGIMRHKAEFYDLKNDPGECRNLIDDPSSQKIIEQLKKELANLVQTTGGLPDKMPLDEGVKKELPAASIR